MDDSSRQTDDPFVNNANWSTFISADGVCFTASDCVQIDDWSTATAPSRTKTFCRKNGQLVQTGSYENDPETSLPTFTMTVNEGEAYPYFKAQKGGCKLYLRDVYRCNGEILAWYDLGEVRVLSGVRSNGQNIFGGTAGVRRWTFTLEHDGDPTYVDWVRGRPRGFERTSELTFVALYQCGHGSCGGPNACGKCSVANQAHGDCDHWYLVETDETTGDVFISESFNGGISFDEVTTISGIGAAISANCDHLFTVNGRLQKCGNSYIVEPLPEEIDTAVTPLVAGDGRFVLFGNNGIVEYDQTFDAWAIVMSNDEAAAGREQFAADSCFVISAADADGTNPGIVYDLSIDGGVTFNTLALSGPFATADDQILDVKIVDGVIAVLVTDGTKTHLYYSTDGRNWMLSQTFGESNDVGNLDITGGIVRVQIGKAYWENVNGLCSCDWSDEKPLTNCPEAIGVCKNDPASWLYTWTPSPE